MTVAPRRSHELCWELMRLRAQVALPENEQEKNPALDLAFRVAAHHALAAREACRGLLAALFVPTASRPL